MIPDTLWGHFSNPAELPIWKETEATSQHAALGQSGCQLCECDGTVTADVNLSQAFSDGQPLRRSLVWTAWSQTKTQWKRADAISTRALRACSQPREIRPPLSLVQVSAVTCLLPYNHPRKRTNVRSPTGKAQPPQHQWVHTDGSPHTLCPPQSGSNVRSAYPMLVLSYAILC